MYVYLLRCADDSLYVGRTEDLSEHENWHNNGHGAVYTAARRPVRVVYAEEHPSEVSAARRERQIKRWKIAKKEALVATGGSALKRWRATTERPAVTWRDLLNKSENSQ